MTIAKWLKKLLKLKSMRFKCANQCRGCQEIMVEEAMISHETECISRLINCPRIQCISDVPLIELLDHTRSIEPTLHLWKLRTSKKKSFKDDNEESGISDNEENNTGVFLLVLLYFKLSWSCLIFENIHFLPRDPVNLKTSWRIMRSSEIELANFFILI